MLWKASERSEKITYAIRDVVLEASKLEKQGKKILYLNIGDPLKYDFRTPDHLWNAIHEHKRESESYAPSEGIPEAREAIAEDFRKKGMNVDAGSVMIGNGCSELIWFSLSCIANPGENILLPKPCYPIYSAAMPYFEIKENYYSLNEENQWQPDLDDIRKKINEKTKALVLINPNNPTGNNYSKKTLEEIAGIAAENKLVIFSDEIYDQLLLEKNEKHYCMGKIAKDVPVIVSNGLSKNFLATGLRIGWLAPNEFLTENSDLMEAIFRLGRARLCAIHPCQYAIKPALHESKKHLEDSVKKLRERRDYAIKRCEEIERMHCVKPNAAFYAFPRVSGFKNDLDFALNLLREKGVCIVHGSGFGQSRETGHFRIVILPPVEILEEAFNKINDFLT